jgi:hypothetical protein
MVKRKVNNSGHIYYDKKGNEILVEQIPGIPANAEM